MQCTLLTRLLFVDKLFDDGLLRIYSENIMNFLRLGNTCAIVLVVLGMFLLCGCTDKSASTLPSSQPSSDGSTSEPSQPSSDDSTSEPSQPSSDGSTSEPSQPSQQCQCTDADTVDGFHASAVPSPNTLLALDSSGKLPADITGDAQTLNGYNSSDFVLKGELKEELNSLVKSSISGYVFKDAVYVVLNPFPDVYTNPVEGAIVELENTSFITHTDSRGYFLLDDVPAGFYFLRISKNGHCTARESFLVVGTTYTGPVPIRLPVVPSKPSGVSVQNVGSGRVKISGWTSPGAYITIYFSSTQGGKFQCVSTSVDSTGYFEAELRNLTSGVTYYYEVEAFKWSFYRLHDNPLFVTNPPACVDGYAFYKQCSSERISGSFVAP